MSLPQLKGPADHLRHGFSSMQREAQQLHPVESMQREGLQRHKLDIVSRTYGSHMAMRLATEQLIFSRPHRLPGLASSSIGMDVVCGNDAAVSFSDFLGGMT